MTEKIENMDSEVSEDGTEIRATFLFDTEVLGKVRGIAHERYLLQKDIINEALKNYIQSYEKEIGRQVKPLPARPTKKKGPKRKSE